MSIHSSTLPWLRRRNAANTSPSDSEPMDEEEQENLVRTLEKDQAKQEQASKRCLSMIIAFIILLHLYLMSLQIMEPFSTKLTAYFRDNMSKSRLAAYFGFASYAYIAALVRLNTDHEQKVWSFWSLTGWIDAFLMCYHWTKQILYMYTEEGYGPLSLAKLFWLPLGPLLIFSIVDYMLVMFAGNKSDIRKLRASMYSLKTA